MTAYQPPQCPTCGAPTKDGHYRNDALIDETAKRLAAERELAETRKTLNPS